MEPVYIFLGLWGFGLVYFVVGLLRVPYKSHKNMTVKNVEVWDYGSFEDFLREFKGREWRVDDDYEASVFEADTEKSYFERSKIHANIVSFNNRGMVMSSWREYRKMKKFIKSYCEENNPESKPNREEGLWEQEGDGLNMIVDVDEGTIEILQNNLYELWIKGREKEIKEVEKDFEEVTPVKEENLFGGG